VSATATRRIRAIALCASLLALPLAGSAHAAGLPDDGGAEWRLEQPAPPEPPVGVSGGKVPIGLGHVSDIEFEAPNRGALITAGSGNTIPPGVWLYNGVQWVELSDKCGASDRGASQNAALIGRGRIVWTGADEFWTVSDGRPGQAEDSRGNPAPIEDNTLCHFTLGAEGQLAISTSYGSPAFESDSYQAMAAAACITPSDCWFGGDLLPEPQTGFFQLHWNGHTLTREPFLSEGHQIGDMATFGGRVFESLRIRESDPSPVKKEGHVGEVPAVHVLNPEGVEPAYEAIEELPLLAPQEFPTALDYLHLSSDEDALWGAAGAQAGSTPSGSSAAGVTVVRYSRSQYSDERGEYVEEATPTWSEVIGPCPTLARACEPSPPTQDPLPEDVVKSIAAEPSSDSAWLGLDSDEDAEAAGGASPTAPALLARVAGNGAISDRLELPGKGATESITCPGPHDCWLVTTQGWLFHLADEAERASPQFNGDPAFTGSYLVTERPPDEGVPQQTALALPVEEGEESTAPPLETGPVTAQAVDPFATVAVPLVSNVRTKLIHGTTLELSFRLSVKARVRLLAKRHSKVVASTATHTWKAGKHSLTVRLNVHRWPTKLDLQTHALAPLKTVSTRESNVGSVSTSERAPGTAGLLKDGDLGLGWLG
jgi:hypothetical protein